MIRIAAGLLALVALAPSAQAFDCAKASTPVERTICDHPELKVADDAMGAAYAGLRASLSESQVTALKADQRDWLRRRDAWCSENGDGKHPIDDACLMNRTTERTRLLLGEAEVTGQAAPTFVPVFFRQVDERRRIEIATIHPQVTAPESRATAALNHALASVVTGSEVDVARTTDPYSRIASYRIGYASGALVSVGFSIYEYTGGAHGIEVGRTINFLLAEGRMMRLDDVVDERGLAALIPLCRASLTGEKRLRGVPAEMIESSLGDEALLDGIKTIASWTFGSAGVEIHYDPYALGSYAEGAYDCKVSWVDLRRVARPDAPLPFP